MRIGLHSRCMYTLTTLTATYCPMVSTLAYPVASSKATTNTAITNPMLKSKHHHLNSRISSRLFSNVSNKDGLSSFQPPQPPNSKGMPIFADVEMKEDIVSIRSMDENAIFVVTGASRGIGLALVKTLLERTKGRVIACCRSPTDFDAVRYFGEQSARVTALKLDLEDQSTIDELATQIRTDYQRVDGLFNVAGILGDGQTTPGPERSLTMLDRDWIEKGLAVNVIGPTMLVKALSPLMKTKRQRKQREETAIGMTDNRDKTVVVNLSARVGSISDNGLGGWYSYRFSKAALNQATRTMAHELKRQGTLAIAVHPGTTDTDLSRPFHKNVKEGSLFPVDFTAGQILTLIDSMHDEVSKHFFVKKKHL